MEAGVYRLAMIDYTVAMAGHEVRERAFEHEAMPHTASLLRAAISITRDSAVAEDLVQETLLRAWRFFDRFDQGTNCKAWLFRIMPTSRCGCAKNGPPSPSHRCRSTRPTLTTPRPGATSSNSCSFAAPSRRCRRTSERPPPGHRRWIHLQRDRRTVIAAHGNGDVTLEPWPRLAPRLPRWTEARPRKGDVLMRCNEFDDLASLYLSDELDAARRRDFDQHVAGCSTCASLLGHQVRADELLRSSLATLPVPTAAVRSRVSARIHAAPWWREIFQTRRFQFALASTLLVIVIISFLRSRSDPRAAYLFETAAADHVECVVQRIEKAGWLTDVGATEQLAIQIVGDARPVRGLAPAGYTLVKARPCRLEGKAKTGFT